MELLISGARILSMDDALGDLDDADIHIRDDVIHAIGPSLIAPGAQVIDARGMIAMPGLVNAHIHTWQTALRGIGVDWTGADYHRNVHSRIATGYTAEDNRVATQLAALAQISGGTTTLFDWCHNLTAPDMTDASIDALQSSGIRAVFGHGTAKPPPGQDARPYWEIPQPADEVRRLRKGRLSSDSAAVTLALCILGPDWGEYDVAVHDIRLARELGLLTSAHTWGRAGSRRCPDGMRRLAEAGLLGPDHNLSHGNNLDDDELKLIVDAGCTVTATPLTEMLNADRPAVMGRVEALGQTASIGSDLAPHFSGSMLAVARYAFQHQRELDNRQLAFERHWPAAGHATTARRALRWATLGGARALRLEDRIGSLTPGKQADVVLVRTDAPHFFPAGQAEPANAVLMYAEHADIDTVLVAGRILKRHGRLMLPDDTLRRLQAALLTSRERLLPHGLQPAP